MGDVSSDPSACTQRTSFILPSHRMTIIVASHSLADLTLKELDSLHAYG